MLIGELRRDLEFTTSWERSHAVLAQDRGAGRRVLVVDDSEQLRALIVLGLQRSGYHTDSAASAAEALPLQPETYDVVLIDLQLGADSGADLLEALRTRDPTAPSRCVLMTGGSVSPDLPTDIPVLVKPFRIEELLAAVERLV